MHEPHHQQEICHHEHNKVPVVVGRNASIEEQAVVVHLVVALDAQAAMVRERGHGELALRAVAPDHSFTHTS